MFRVALEIEAMQGCNEIIFKVTNIVHFGVPCKSGQSFIVTCINVSNEVLKNKLYSFISFETLSSLHSHKVKFEVFQRVGNYCIDFVMDEIQGLPLDRDSYKTLYGHYNASRTSSLPHNVRVRQQLVTKTIMIVIFNLIINMSELSTCDTFQLLSIEKNERKNRQSN